MEKEQMIELVRKSQAGDMDAMNELIRKAHTSVSYQCRKLLKNAQDAEDVTQEVMLTVYTKLGSLQEPAAFWGWLSRITANRCMNALSRTHVDLQILEDEDGHSMLDDIENLDKQLVPDEAIDNAETRRMIWEIVGKLPEAQRMVTLLFYYDELSVKQIASIMGTSENTAKSRLNYARKALKDGVLDYEKKHGVKLHVLSPIPFLLYFLRKEAEEGADPAAAQAMAERVMAQGAAMSGATAAETAGATKAAGATAGGTSAAGTAASGASASASAAGAAGTAAAHALGGLSLKAVAVIAAGVIAAGGAAVGISAAVSHRNSSPADAVAVAAENESAEEIAEEEPTSEAQTETEEIAPLFSAQVLSQLPYTGNIEECVMTSEQAEAFAQVLEECIAESQMPVFGDPICRAALFDAGDGIPALFVVEGYDMGYGNEFGYMPDISKIYCWDGSQVILSLENDTDIWNCILTDQGLLIDYFWPVESNYNYSELYSLSEGIISQEPQHVYEHFAFFRSDLPTDLELKDAVERNGHPGISYDYSTLTADKYRYFEYEEIGEILYEDVGWLIAAFDGTFLSVDHALASGQALEWGAVTWILGYGTAGNQDVNQDWAGSWGSADEVAALLRNGGTNEDAASGSGEPENIFSSGTSGVADDLENGLIRRKTMEPQVENLEVYYEIPVFDESGAGYQKINAFFQNLQDGFFSEDNEDLAWIREMANLNPPDEAYPYYYTTSARVNDWTDKLVSVSLSYDWYMGGVADYGITNYNFRTDTGEQLLLNDLLDGTETDIKEMIVDAMNQAYPDLFDALPEALEAIRNYSLADFDFYVADGHVYVCFDKYELAYGAAGSFEAELPAELKAAWQ